MMTTYKKCRFIFIAIILIFCSFSSGFLSIVALSDENYPDIYKDVATNFLKNQYEQREIEYRSFSIILETEMYSSTDDVVAKALVASRDDEYDYVVLNLATSEIDEYAFNDQTVLERFSEKVYYTGLLNYFTKKDDKYLHFDNTEISHNEFNKRSEKINASYRKLKNEASKRIHSDSNPLPNPSKDGWNGFYSWSNLSSFNSNNNYWNEDWHYLPGINWNGITGTGLSFFDQNTFNNRFGTNNSCGPTALTNMFVWFQNRNITNRNGNVNALLNGNAFDTYNRFRQLTNHSNTNGTNTGTYTNALNTFALEQGYNRDISSNITSFNSFKSQLDNDRPILTSIQLSGWGGHAVLTVGYEIFTQSYEQEHQFLWIKWTTTEYRYARYLRIIDGWSTSNSSRFIDFGGYWDSVTGWSFNIRG